jgi:hypothetical protein
MRKIISYELYANVNANIQAVIENTQKIGQYSHLLLQKLD